MPPLSPFMHVFGGPGRGSGDVEGKGGGERETTPTWQLLQYSFYGPRATATAHGDSKYVLVFRHGRIIDPFCFKKEDGWEMSVLR